MYIKCITFFSVSPTEFESVCFYAHTVFVALYFLLSSGVMPTKPGSCALPCYGIEFAVLDPVVSAILSLCVIYICSPLLFQKLSVRCTSIPHLSLITVLLTVNYVHLWCSFLIFVSIRVNIEWP